MGQSATSIEELGEVTSADCCKMAAEVSENGAENFPGLNKRHGFFKAIERNQRDRDLYHQQTEVSSHRNSQDGVVVYY